ncbi:acyltransferase family protein [Marinicella sediminis]|uniref:Acyltransferase family protein n=1 Tax=Marinicella sediminis TaxID=1792834 RepID=A0ABV7JA92_9GAMM|nr:acyltransferase family protein [Marinicella sediminis]
MTAVQKTFRKDIQGLRALAVLAVILDHLEVPFSNGGFIGVDVFFTLSGFLITRLIVERLQGDGFKLFGFYKNRFWRLFPALLVTLAVTLLVAVLLFPAVLISDTAEASLAALFSVSNLYFFTEAGYWDYTAKYKPLLHTWSLGVEEQFYVLYPAMLIWAHLRKWNLRLILLAMAVLSLLLSVVVTASNPDAGFYLLPFRVFEFCLGGLVCLWPQQRLSERLSALIGVLALAVLVACVYAFEFIERFPSWWPLIPCLACAVLLLIRPVGFNRIILEHPVMVAIGNFSYSWYLVHWPVVVFYLFVLPHKPEGVDQVIMFSGSLLLAVLLHRFVEQPFRYHRRNSWLLWFFVLLLIWLCFWLISRDGQLKSTVLPVSEVTSLSDKAVNLQRYQLWFSQCDTHSRGISEQCLEPHKISQNVLIVGDSFGIDGFNIMSAWQPDNHYILMSEKGCPPIINTSQVLNKSCDAVFDRLLHYLTDNPGVDEVVYSIRIDFARLPALRKSIQTLIQHPVRVTVLGVGPQYQEQARILAHGATDFAEASKRVNQHQQNRLYVLNEQAKEQVEQAGARYIDKLSYFCPQQQCRVFTEDQKEMVTYDRNHLSLGASMDYAKYLVQFDSPREVQ